VALVPRGGLVAALGWVSTAPATCRCSALSLEAAALAAVGLALAAGLVRWREVLDPGPWPPVLWCPG
jgi:hypothetical protein